jgi:hypothetical protein
MLKHWGKVYVFLLLISASSVQGAEHEHDKESDGLTIDFLEFLGDEEKDIEQMDMLMIKELMEKKKGPQANDE